MLLMVISAFINAFLMLLKIFVPFSTRQCFYGRALVANGLQVISLILPERANALRPDVNTSGIYIYIYVYIDIYIKGVPC